MILTYLEHSNSYKKDANQYYYNNNDRFRQPVHWLQVGIVQGQQQQSRTQNATKLQLPTELSDTILAPPKHHAHFWTPL